MQEKSEHLQKRKLTNIWKSSNKRKRKKKSKKEYVVKSINFQTFFLHGFKIVIDSGKFSMLLLYILWDDRPIFMISGSNEQLQ